MDRCPSRARAASPSTCRTRTRSARGWSTSQLAEQHGFEAVWQAESRLVREATVPMAAFAAVTERIKVGSGVVDMLDAQPGLLAATFSTLDDLAPGRVILGHRRVVGSARAKVGIDRASARSGDARDRRGDARGCSRTRRVTFDGEFVHLDGVELDYVHQERPPEGRADLHRRDGR